MPELALRRHVVTPFAIAAVLAAALGFAARDAAAADQSVSIINLAFSPASVSVSVGDTVTWTNNDAGIPHTATSDAPGVFDSGTLNTGGTYAKTFTEAGTFPYHCNIHPTMTGTVVVAAAQAPTATATTAAATATATAAAATATTAAPAATTAAATPTTGSAAPTATIAAAASPTSASATAAATTSPVPPASGDSGGDDGGSNALLIGAGVAVLVLAAGGAAYGLKQRRA